HGDSNSLLCATAPPVLLQNIFWICFIFMRRNNVVERGMETFYPPPQPQIQNLIRQTPLRIEKPKPRQSAMRGWRPMPETCELKSLRFEILSETHPVPCMLRGSAQHYFGIL